MFSFLFTLNLSERKEFVYYLCQGQTPAVTLLSEMKSSRVDF